MTDFPDARMLQATAPKDMITRVHRGLTFVLRIAAKWPGAGVKPMNERTLAERSFDAARYQNEARRKVDRLLLR